jgi:hypothetical protein
VLDETDNREMIHAYHITYHDADEHPFVQPLDPACAIRNLLFNDAALCSSTERYILEQKSLLFPWGQTRGRLAQPQQQSLSRHRRKRSMPVSVAFFLCGKLCAGQVQAQAGRQSREVCTHESSELAKLR